MHLFRSFIFFVVTIIVAFSKDGFFIDKYLAAINLHNFSYLDNYIEKYSNNDIVGRLIIESLNIDTPIVQANDNKFYLNYDEYKNKNSVGAIFLDYRNTIDVDRKLLVYGHNSRTVDTIFNKLEKYLSSSFYNVLDNRIIQIETRNKKSLYEVINVLIVGEGTKHMQLSFTNNEWEEHVNWINRNSLYNNKLTFSDDVMIMQTCYYEPNNSFLLIVSKKINESYF